ncbi:hypothetical protein [Rhodocyclus purpureus]|uniref:hypothetical protein n=1 Tax=Rhodocyclus purpureus TaxID=1067 RepID=UPI001911EBAB|nr:hypothetical protein [Rhodocyclus purpureus]MBK5915127.1 hypothetical protein [Rhodocyclus purpureus]
MPLLISDRIREKLAGKNPPVSEQELVQCFANQTREPLIDLRSEHLTDPPTRWFVGETDYGRKIKIMYVNRQEGTHIKSAYDADQNIIRIYNKYAKPL